MRILFDQGVPAPLRRHLSGHEVDTTFERGWSGLGNGGVARPCRIGWYHLLVTTDQNLRHQQNLAGWQLAIVVLLAASWPRIERRVDDIRAVVDGFRLDSTLRSRSEGEYPNGKDNGHLRARVGTPHLHGADRASLRSTEGGQRGGGPPRIRRGRLDLRLDPTTTTASTRSI